MAVATTTSSDSAAARAPSVDWVRILSSRWMLAVILVLAFAVYAPTLNDWFASDDFWFIRASQTHSVGDYIMRSLDFRNVGSSPEYDRYRPLYPILWRLEYSAFGMNAFYYHAVVVALHLICVVLVWMIARHLFAAAWASNLATLIFALHPAYADAVAWISANRVFEAFPYLVSLLLFLKFADTRASPDPGAAREPKAASPWPVATYTGSVLFFIAAILMHSSALTLVAVLAAYRFLLAGGPHDARRVSAWLPLVPFVVIGAAYGGIQLWVRGHLASGDAFQFGYNQYAIYAEYLGLAMVPLSPGNAMLPAWIANAQKIGSVVMLAAIVLTLAARPPRWIAIFSAFWLLAALFLDSTLIFTISGRALYVPGVAFAAFAVATIIWAHDILPARWRTRIIRAAPLALLLITAGAMFATYERASGVSHASSRNERFAQRLTRDIPPPLADGATLYIANPPDDLSLLGNDSYLRTLVQSYYGDVNVKKVTPADSVSVEASLKPGDRFYNYRP